jgi:ankyrin repeat protein
VLQEILDLPIFHKSWDSSDEEVPWRIGSTALHNAVQAGPDDDGKSESKNGVIRMLLKHGANPNAVNKDLCTPLHLAATGCNLDAAFLLIEFGAAVDPRDDDGHTPLMRACRTGELDVVEFLCDNHADLTARCPQGMNVLSCCAESSPNAALFEVLRRMLPPEAGFDRDIMGYSPVHDAILNQGFTGYILSGVVDLSIIADGPDLSKGLFSLLCEGGGDAATKTLHRVLKRWPKHGLHRFINNRPPRYVSPLCNAAIRGYASEVKLLLRHGANVDLEGCEHGTALMAAAVNGRLGIVKLLVLAGASIAYTDRRGRVRTALSDAKTAESATVEEWLLVGRYTEQKRLQERPRGDGDETAVPANWSGVGQLQYSLEGMRREHLQLRDESMMEYLTRMAKVKRSLRGKVVVS